MAKSLEDTGYLLIFALFKDKCYENRMESMQYDKYVALDILNKIHISIGIQDFEKIIEDGYVYLDKTGLVYDLVHNETIYFLSRPRRFGKSLLVSTLKCYFEGKKELFKGLAIDKQEKEWKQYPVFHLDFNGNNFTNPGVLEQTLMSFVERQEAIYGRAMIYQSGYLTIKDWEMDTNSYLLDFPNDEVKHGFLTMLATRFIR